MARRETEGRLHDNSGVRYIESDGSNYVGYCTSGLQVCGTLLRLEGEYIHV